MAESSHRLRTPLAAIIGYTELLQEVAEDEDRTADQRDLGRIRKAAQELLATIDTMVVGALDAAGRLTIHAEAVESNRLVREALEATTSLAISQGNQVLTDLPDRPPVALADPRRTALILVNLLQNAHQHTEGGTITVRARQITAGQDYRVELEIQDTGSGMSAAAIAHHLDPDAGGAGMGLRLSRALARHMGGELSLQSERRSGTRAILTLPCADSPTLIPGADHLPLQRSPSVLLVNLANGDAEALRGMLARDGWAVHEGLDGATLRDRVPQLAVFEAADTRTWSRIEDARRDPGLSQVALMVIGGPEDAPRCWLGRIPFATRGTSDSLALAELLLQDSAPPSAMVVEAHPVRRDQLAAPLRDRGFAVTALENGELALDLATARPPDLLVLGADVGEGPGPLDTLAVLRGVPSTRRTPVIYAPDRPVSTSGSQRLRRARCTVLPWNDPPSAIVDHLEPR